MKKILLGLIIIVSYSAFSQSSNNDFSMAFAKNPSFTAGLDKTAQQGNIFQVKVQLKDVNQTGQLIVMVYDLPTNTPIAIVRLDQQEILSGTYTEKGLIVFNIPHLDPNSTYKVILESQNSQMDYLPRIEKNYPIN